MIFGSSTPVQYFYFYCKPKVQAFYMTTNFLFVMILSKIVTDEKFQHAGKESQRTVFFLLYGFFSIIPFLHYAFTENNGIHLSDAKVFSLVFMATIYTVGALLYAAYVPERFSPGKFDLFVIFTDHNNSLIFFSKGIDLKRLNSAMVQKSHKSIELNCKSVNRRAVKWIFF